MAKQSLKETLANEIEFGLNRGDELPNIETDFRVQENELIRTTSTRHWVGTSSIELVSEELRSADSDALKRAWLNSQIIDEGKTKHNLENKAIKIIDIFSGCGGLSLGARGALESLGVRQNFRAAVDIDDVALQVYQRNFRPRITVNTSAMRLVDYQLDGYGSATEFLYLPEIVSHDFHDAATDCDLLIGGPPCQGHSNLNNKTRRHDPKNQLYFTMPAIAVALNVPLLVIENVPEVLKDKTGVVESTISLLTKAGYFVDHGVIDGLSVGLSQTRKRHFLVASKYSQPNISETVHALEMPSMVLEDVIGDLLNLGAEASNFDQPANLSTENCERINYLFENDLYDLPNQQRPDCHKNGTTYKSVYGRLSLDKPSGTITTGFLSPGRGRYIHPTNRRGLTPHEGARIQSFPDSFRWLDDYGNHLKNSNYSKLIGDAVPPMLGRAAVLSALATFQEA